VLFLFNILYLLLSRLKSVPNISLKRAVCSAFLIGWVYSAGMDIFGLRGWTKIGVLDFQNERLLIYFMFFLLGTLCFRLKVFDAKPKSRMLYIIVNSISWIPITVYIFFLLYPWLKPGSFIVSQIVDRLIVWFCFGLSLLCLVYTMIETFRRYFDKPGKIWNELNRNSYYVYIIHVIVIGGIALPLLNSAMPSLLKYLVLTVSTYAASNLIVHLYRKIIESRIRIKRKWNVELKTATTAMLLVVLLTVAGCGKQENSDKEKRPPRVSLHVAALQGNLDAIRQHINADSDLNKKDAYGSSPLIVAATFGKTEIARALIDAGADMKITNNEFCRTEIVKTLLDKGADKNALNKAGRTALESVSRPFDDVKGIYDGIGKGLKPLGLKLDYDRIKMTRPRIAEMLR
jgi:hypothetical protein